MARAATADIVAAFDNVDLPDEGWARAVCPVCAADRTWTGTGANLSLNVESTYYYCWRCHTKGFLNPKAARVVRARQLGRREDGEHQPPPLPDGFFTLDVTPRSQAFVGYLRSRGVADDAIIQAGIGGVGPSNKIYGWNVVLPVYSVDVKYQGFVARHIVEKVYRYPKGMRRAESMWNANSLRALPVAVVVEGVFDALPYFPFAVACLGKPTDKQAAILAANASKVIVALDNDAARRGWTFTQELRLLGVDATFLELPRGKDPGSVPKHLIYDEIQRRIDHE